LNPGPLRQVAAILPAETGAYPAELAHEARLPDGTLVLIRPIHAQDENALTTLVARSTPDDIRLLMPVGGGSRPCLARSFARMRQCCKWSTSSAS
jgi:hypothetical protein